MDDSELVERARAGDRAAFEELVYRWAPGVLTCCRLRVRHDAADDVAQEAWLQCLLGLSGLREPDCFGAWMRGIAARLCRNWHRRRSREPQALGDEARAITAEIPDDATELADELRALREAVAALPPRYSETIVLYYSTEGCTYENLAQLLDVSAATVNLRLTRGRALLRKRMNARG